MVCTDAASYDQNDDTDSERMIEVHGRSRLREENRRLKMLFAGAPADIILP